MVAARKIRCVVVTIPAENDGMNENATPRFRPSDLLPWADPHIRSLVEQLQAEVREEVASARLAKSQPTLQQSQPTLAPQPKLAGELASEEPLCEESTPHETAVPVLSAAGLEALQPLVDAGMLGV